MAQANRQFISTRTLAIISAVLLVATLILFFVDYRAGIALLIGLALAWIATAALRWASHHVKAAVIIGGVGVLACGALFVVTILLGSRGVAGGIPPAGDECPVELNASDMIVIVDGKNLASDSVTVAATLNGTKKVQYFPKEAGGSVGPSCPPEGEAPLPTLEVAAQTVTAESRGFMLKEIAFNTLDLVEKGVNGYDGINLSDAKISLELRNFPRGSFYQARDVKAVDSSPYLDTETIKWAPPESDVIFSYIPPGWGIMRPIVDLLYGAQTIDKIVLGAVGSLGTLILGTVTEVVVGRFVKKPLENLIDKKAKDAPKT